MQPSDPTHPEGRGPGGQSDATTRSEAAAAGGGGQDRLVGIVILVLGAFLFWATFSFKTVVWDPLGLPFWPRIVR